MKGIDIIKTILNENGLQTEYVFAKSTDMTEEPIHAECLADVCDVTCEYGELVLRTEYPLIARRYGLSDRYRKYAWDGSTIYLYHHDNEPADWSFAFGGHSQTVVTEAVKRFRTAMVDEMLRQAGQPPTA